MVTRRAEAWVVFEFAGGSPTQASLETFAFATLAVAGGAVKCVAVGANAYDSDSWTQAIAAAVESKRPDFVFIPHTSTGWDYAPAFAARLKASLITAINAVRPGDSPVFSRAVCGGKLVEEVAVEPGKFAVVTVMPGAAKFDPANASLGAVETLHVHAQSPRVKSLGLEPTPPRSFELDTAEVVVSGGRGVGGPEGLLPLKELASLFHKGALGASRPVCDNGWAPMETQVGMTGRTVSPKLYIACGISGAIQHTAGMSGSRVVVAINTDPGALFFRVADYCVLENIQSFVPLLIEKIRELKKE